MGGVEGPMHRLDLLVRTFSTASFQAGLRAAASGGRPRPDPTRPEPGTGLTLPAGPKVEEELLPVGADVLHGVDAVHRPPALADDLELVGRGRLEAAGVRVESCSEPDGARERVKIARLVLKHHVPWGDGAREVGVPRGALSLVHHDG